MVRFVDMFTELVRAEIVLWNTLDAHLSATVGVSLAQYEALAAIRAEGDGARVQGISRAMSITVGAASKVVDRLERDGLAVRSAHPTDRRSSLVAPTERGASALRSAEAAAEEYLRELLGATLTDSNAECFLAQLAAVRLGTQQQAMV